MQGVEIKIVPASGDYARVGKDYIQHAAPLSWMSLFEGEKA